MRPFCYALVTKRGKTSRKLLGEDAVLRNNGAYVAKERKPVPLCSMKRRSFFSLLPMLGAQVMSSGAESQTKIHGWKTAVGLNGFQSGTRKYKANYPIWEVADFAAREGFDGVELVSDWPMGGYPKSVETEKIRALKRFWDGFGLRIFSIQLGADGGFHADADVRRRWLETMTDRIKLARQLGCARIGMWPYGALGNQTIDQAIENLGRSFKAVAKIAEDFEILAAFEIEPPFIFNTEAHLRRILSTAEHPNLNTIYDPSHFDLMSGSSGKPHEMLARVGVKNIGYVHFTDCDGTLRDGGTSKHLGAGDGHIDIAASLKMLRDGGFRGWIMMDEWEVPDPYDACRKGLEAVRNAW
jgi:sugar phosphate isomerase/epimerase